MRNLKRALSLGLTAAMISGLMVMGSSAASYADVTSENNVEAIEVLEAVGIMIGDENGDFNPDQNVTRNEMAVIMSNLMAYNVATYSGTSPFTDVPSWAEPYVAACWTNGITAGTSDTTYGGDQTVTTAQAALMIMKALGYFQYGSDFGSDWQLATVSQGNKIDLFVDVNSGVKEAMTRNDVAQLVLNGLESGTVQAETNGSITVGDITIVNDVKYNLITSGEKYAYAINPDLKTSNDGTVSTGSIVELGEKLYLGDLAKKCDVDDFGRPSSVWSYNSNEIGTYADEATYSHNTKVTSKALYNEVGSIAASDYEWFVFHNGVKTDYAGKQLVANKTENDTDFVAKALGGTARTGTGVLTEVYVNNVEKEVYVAIVDTFVGQVTKVEDDAVTIKQFDGDTDHQAPKLDSKKFETTDSGLAVDDIVLYTVSGKEIMSLQKAESVTGTLTAYQAKGTGENKDSYAKLDDTQYTYAVQMAKNLENNTDIYPDGLNNEYVFYLDTFGNLIAFEGVEVIDNYLYVENAVKSAAGVDAKVRFADGTQKVINISKVKLSTGTKYDDATNVGLTYDTANTIVNGGIYTYSEDNGLYRLTNLALGSGKGEFRDLNGTYDFDGTPASSETAYGIKQGHSRLFTVNYTTAGWTETTTASYPVDSTTIFVDMETGEVFTGYQNVPSYGAMKAKVAFGKNGVIDVVFIYNQEEKSNTGVYFFVDGDSRETWETNDITYRKYEVYIDGEKQELVTKDLTLTKNSVYKQIQVNADGQLVDADLVYSGTIISGVMGNVTNENKVTSIANNTLVLASGNPSYYNGKTIFNWDDETVFVNIETKYDGANIVVDTVEPGDATDIDVVNYTTAVYILSVNDKSNVAPTAKLVYIVTQPDAEDASYTVTIGAKPANIQTLSVTDKATGAEITTGTTVKSGTVLHIEATAVAGYTADVKVNGTSKGNSFDYTVSGATNIVAEATSVNAYNGQVLVDFSTPGTTTIKYEGTAKPTMDEAISAIIEAVTKADPTQKFESANATNPAAVTVVFKGTYAQTTYTFDYTSGVTAATLYSGKINGENVTVDSADDLATLAGSVTGTYYKLNSTTGVTGGTNLTVGTTTYAQSTANINADNFDVDLSTGYVKVSGATAVDVAVVGSDYTIPAKADFTSAKGTGVVYTINSTSKYAAYAGTIPSSEINGSHDITLAQDYVQVTVVMTNDPDDSFKVATTEDTTGLTDAAGTTYVEVGSTITISNETVSGNNDVYAAISDGDTINVTIAQVSNGSNKTQVAAEKDITVTINNTNA